MDDALTVLFPVGLEEAEDGATLVHSFTLPGCVAAGATHEEALEAFPAVLEEWLKFRESRGEPVPPAGSELAVAVNEWMRSDAAVSEGESTACFEDDLRPLAPSEINEALASLGALRGVLLAQLRRAPEAELERTRPGGWSVRTILDELARAQWWTLTRLGASPMAEVPDRILGRLDTAMALVVQQLTGLDEEARGRVLELDGERWTPRKVVRRLLWLEWALGGGALQALEAEEGPQ
jgi:predicted RNase H-like HicB family nuclease